MEEEDDFGDLYTDVLYSSPLPTSLSAKKKPPPITSIGGGSDSSDEKEDKIIPGSPLPLAPESSSIDRERQVSPEDAGDDWLLGGDPAPVEEPANWVDDDEEVVADGDSKHAGGGFSYEGGGGARVMQKEDAEEAGEDSKELRDPDDGAVITAVPNGVVAKASESDDWDSGSEDDLQIVLNDSGHDLLGVGRRDGGGSDEDDEVVVIVTDDDQRHLHQAMEEQDWGDDAIQASVDGEKKEMVEVAKASGAAPTVAGGGIGYSNHGFHPQHHSMFKYVRPGATPTPRGPGVVAAGALGQVRPPAFGPLPGRGRGDWRPVSGIGFPNMQKGFHSGYGLPTWGNTASGRPFGSGLDFSLPSHKTVFDIDIESFEEKPWRHPGVDISDFFNFGLDEEHWKEYCKQLEQLRLESTMQGKIRVYESGRSEQDYDPDLPPELAAASSHNNMSVDNINHGKSENGLADLSDQGKGSVCIRPALPTGRPIQVESGYGERLPSIDTKPPRFRDLDAVIEIVLQDHLGDSRNSNGAFEQPENNFGRENQKVFHDVDEDRHAESESEFYSRFPRNSSVQQRESVARRIPTLAEGDGILPFPSESSRQYNSSPKSRSPIDTARSFETQHGGRSLQRTPYGKTSSTSERLSETLPHRNEHLDKHEGHHKERTSNGMEVNRASDSPPSDIAKELSMEPKDVEHDDRLTLGDSHEGDGGEASDIRVSSETVGDDGLINSANRQKFISCVEQSGGQDNGVGDDSRLTHSDNSRARSGNSRDYQKIHETGEEVMQVHPSKHTGDSSKHYEEDDRSQRDDYGRDGRREAGRNRSRGRETMHESYAQKDWDSGSGHTFRGRSVDFEREMDGPVGPWHRREDDTHYRQLKDEDIRRVHNEEIRPRERSKARMIDRKEKIEDHVKKRLDDGDWRGHSRDDGLRHRERNDILMNRRDNLEDGQIKRKRDVELTRRERTDKEDSLHGYRVREDSHRKKRIRDDIVDHRKREDDVRTRSKIEERHSSKHKDDSWYQRDREDRQQLNLPYDDTLALLGREERRFASRSGRPVEKIFAGTGRSKEELKVAGSEKGYHDNDRRRHNELSKRGDRTGEENESLSKVRGDTHTREKRFNAEQRSMRHERLSAHPDRPSGASDEHQVQKERHRDSNKKVEDFEPVGQKGGVSGKRKRGGHNTHRTELNSKVSSEQQNNNRSTAESKKARGNSEQMEASLLPAARRGDDDPASDVESHDSRRGRSKLERWTSHKERDYSIIDSNIQPSSIVREVEDSQDELNELVKADASKSDNTETNADDLLQVADKVGEDRDRHLDTVAKLKMRSERFKLPMPGEKDKDLTGNKKVESEALPSCIQNEAVSTASADLDIKLERPARKRKWTGS